MATILFPSPPSRLHHHHHHHLLLSSRRPNTLRIRCSADEASSTTAEPEGWTGGEGVAETSESSLEFSSLISADNVQKALRGVAITSADHYGRLGIARGTSYDKVEVAYKNKCEELANQGLDEEETNNRMLLLKESYEILSSEEERRLYDWSLARSENPDRYLWPFEVDITQTPTQIPPPGEAEDVGSTRLVGSFFLTWSLINCTLRNIKQIRKSMGHRPVKKSNGSPLCRYFSRLALTVLL